MSLVPQQNWARTMAKADESSTCRAQLATPYSLLCGWWIMVFLCSLLWRFVATLTAQRDCRICLRPCPIAGTTVGVFWGCCGPGVQSLRLQLINWPTCTSHQVVQSQVPHAKLPSSSIGRLVELQEEASEVRIQSQLQKSVHLPRSVKITRAKIAIQLIVNQNGKLNFASPWWGLNT